MYGVDLSQEGLSGTAAVAPGPGHLMTRVADVADEDAVVETVREAADRLGGIDVLVNVSRSRSPGSSRSPPRPTRASSPGRRSGPTAARPSDPRKGAPATERD